MARTNTKNTPKPVFTHEGAKASHISPEQELRRSVMACLLWEDNFYESGVSITDRISDLCAKVKPGVIAALAIEARTKQHLRHVPLLLLKNLVKYGKGEMVADAIHETISRADEITELVSLYWDGKNKKMLPNQMKKGLARAFLKFDEYKLAKYNRDTKVKLRDVLFLSHAKPKTPEQEDLWKRLVENKLAIPDTWETQLSGGANKKETFERLIREKKLGYFALLRNLRNMLEAGCDLTLVKEAIIKSENGADKILPFRYVAAARAAPRLEPEIDIALGFRIGQLPVLSGKTIVLVDVSGSMDSQLSGKSDLKRIDAAAALASVINAKDLRVFTFSNNVIEVPPRRGMAGVDAVIRSQFHRGTHLGAALQNIYAQKYDRLIVITDEQSHDRVPEPLKGRLHYLINVANNKNGVGYGNGWIHVDGFSENIIRWIIEQENSEVGDEEFD